MIEIFADVAKPNGNGGTIAPQEGADPTIAIIVATAVVAIVAIVISVILVQKSSKKNGKKSH